MRFSSNVRRFIAAGEGEAFWWKGGSKIVFKANAADSAGQYALTEALIEPGSGVNPHMHPTEHELFYMLQGSIDVRVGRHAFKAREGDFIAIPPQVPHEFWNREDVPANFINPFVPPGLQEMFRAGGIPAWMHPEPLPDTEAQTRRAIETAQAFGVVGRPDLLDWEDPTEPSISGAEERRAKSGSSVLASIKTENGGCNCYELHLTAGKGIEDAGLPIGGCTIFVVAGSMVLDDRMRLSIGDVVVLKDLQDASLLADQGDATLFVLSSYRAA